MPGIIDLHVHVAESDGLVQDPKRTFSRVNVRFGSCTRPSDSATCTCRSMMPGITYLPHRSCTAAPAGAFYRAGRPPKVMRAVSATSAAFATGAPPLPSIKVKFLRTSAREAAGTAICRATDDARLNPNAATSASTTTTSTRLARFTGFCPALHQESGATATD